jgi:hypothetical protein
MFCLVVKVKVTEPINYLQASLFFFCPQANGENGRACLIRKTLGLVDFGPHVNQKKGGKMYSKNC